MDEMLTPTDIQKHLKIGRNKTYQLIQLSSFPMQILLERYAYSEIGGTFILI